MILTPEGYLDRQATYEQVMEAVFPGRDGPHLYLSTHCLHAVLDNDDSLHERCNAEELAPGVPRQPAQCKHCAGECLCWCHH